MLASRTGINIYISKYFVAVRNCSNIFAVYGVEVRHWHTPHIRTFTFYVRNFFFINGISVNLFVYRSVKYVTTRNLVAIGEVRNGEKFICENEPFVVLILIFRRVLSKIWIYFNSDRTYSR